MTNGTKVPMNTSSTFGNSPMPNHMITMGIQAMGGMGRMTSNILPKNALHFLFHPMRMPKEIPKAHAISSAMSTRLKLAHACPAREVFAMGLEMFSQNVPIRQPGQASAPGDCPRTEPSPLQSSGLPVQAGRSTGRFSVFLLFACYIHIPYSLLPVYLPAQEIFFRSGQKS